MSYGKRKTENSMNAYFMRLRDFNLLSPRLLHAADLKSFQIWLEKLTLIDRRSLVLFLRQHWDELPEEYWDWAKLRLRRLLSEEG